MQVLDKILDEKPTPQLVADMAETRIRNLQCFRELEAFNNFNKYIGNHPLLQEYSERRKYEDLYKKSKSEFLKEYAKIEGYIARYKSYLNRKNATEDKRKNWQELLQHYKRLKTVFIEIMER